MKVLHIIPTLNPDDGGPIEGVLRISEVMADEGVQVEILTLDHAAAPWLKSLPVPVHALGRARSDAGGVLARIRRWANFSPGARNWARQHVRDYDAVVVHSLWNYGTRVAKLALVGSGVPFVVYPHGMLDPWFRRRYPLKHWAKQLLWLINEGLLLGQADRVLFTCEQERLLARTTFRPYRVREQVIAFGAAAPPPAGAEDEKRFRAMLPALGGRRFLLFLSRIHEKKGCDLLVEAFAAAAQRDPGLDLVMAGPDSAGLAAGLRERAAELGVAERIHWPGMVKGAAKYGALRCAEAFVLPSHQENFGIAVAEALSCGCPVLISDQVNIWPEIARAGAGLVASDDLVGTTAMLLQFHETSAAARAQMAEQAAALFADCFDMRRGALDLIATLREITNSPKQLSYR